MSKYMSLFWVSMEVLCMEHELLRGCECQERCLAEATHLPFKEPMVMRAKGCAWLCGETRWWLANSMLCPCVSVGVWATAWNSCADLMLRFGGGNVPFLSIHSQYLSCKCLGTCATCQLVIAFIWSYMMQMFENKACTTQEEVQPNLMAWHAKWHLDYWISLVGMEKEGDGLQIICYLHVCLWVWKQNGQLAIALLRVCWSYVEDAPTISLMQLLCQLVPSWQLLLASEVVWCKCLRTSLAQHLFEDLAWNAKRHLEYWTTLASKPKIVTMPHNLLAKMAIQASLGGDMQNNIDMVRRQKQECKQSHDGVGACMFMPYLPSIWPQN